MEVWLAGGFLPLLLLAWLPAGESPCALNSALNSSIFAYACRRFGTWLLLLFSSPLAAFNPAILHQHLAVCLAKGVPPCNCLCPGCGLCPWGPNFRLQGFEPALTSGAGRENSWGGEENRGAYKPDNCKGGQLHMEYMDIL